MKLLLYYVMVILLHGNSEHVANVRKKIGHYGEEKKSDL